MQLLPVQQHVAWPCHLDLQPCGRSSAVTFVLEQDHQAEAAADVGALMKAFAPLHLTGLAARRSFPFITASSASAQGCCFVHLTAERGTSGRGQ